MSFLLCRRDKNGNSKKAAYILKLSISLLLLASAALILFLNRVENEPSVYEPIDSPCELMTIEEMNEASFGLGTFFVEGMPFKDYQSAIDKTWLNAGQEGEPEGISYDIGAKYSYCEIERFLFDLSKRDDVQLYVIGISAEGRKIYSLEAGSGDKMILLTGNVHTRETAGTSFILKQFEKLVSDAQADPYIKRLLKEYKFAAIPSVNPDGWEHMFNNPSSMKKSNARGVDLNRNMPTSNAEQLAKGEKPISEVSHSPSSAYYPGPHLGSESETKAAISWLVKYIPSAIIYMDYHQSGNKIYGGKTYYEEEKRLSKSKNLAEDIIKFMMRCGGRKWSYLKEEQELARGQGTFTDFAVEYACGFEFSPAYGRLCMNSEKGLVPLLLYQSMNVNSRYYAPRNKDIAIVTPEIGSSESRCYTKKARRLQESVYNIQSFDKLFLFLMERDYAQRYGTEALGKLKS
ncbi:MAG: Zinc carboxypeptidase [Firmicutes bacterium ADurb.Bin182]|nr:MAG: Zinc carboxypeptidase [Firmicutes bacterium ADurb.Bin182]